MLAIVIPIMHSAANTELALFCRRLLPAVRGFPQLEPGTSRTRAGSPETDMVSYVDVGQWLAATTIWTWPVKHWVWF